MEEERKIVLDGFITLEGRFLEKLWAAYLMSKGETVCERYETGGIHHDVLTQSYDSHTLYECTGQERFTAEKINRLRRDALLIKQEINKETASRPLKKVVLISSTNRNLRDNEAKATFERAKTQLFRSGLTLESVDDYDVLYPLLYEGLLGFALIENKLYPVGPEEYGIRYDKNKKYEPFARGISFIDIEKFKRLPQSFLPSLYWGTFYRELQERWAKEEEEFPLSFSHSYSFGISWKTAKDMRDLYKQDLSQLSRTIIDDFEDSAFVEWSWSRKKYNFFNVYVCDSKNKFLDRADISALVGKIMDAAEDYRQKHEYTAKERFSGYLVTSSEDWSAEAWWQARETGTEELTIDASNILRGSNLLIKLLNRGILGFAFAEPEEYTGNVKHTTNQIKLVGPGIPAIRLKDSELLTEPV